MSIDIYATHTDAYKAIALSALTPEDRNFDSAETRLIAVVEFDQGITLFETVVSFDGHEQRYNAGKALLQKARGAGRTVVAIVEVSNTWHLPEGQEWDGPTLADCPYAISGRVALLMDADGTQVQASIDEGSTEPHTEVRSFNVDESMAHVSYTLRAVIRGTKPARCYLCHGQGRLREYGSIVQVDGIRRSQGTFTCRDEDDSCQRRADRKFSQKQQVKHLRENADAMQRFLLKYTPEEHHDAVLEAMRSYKEMLGH